MEGITIKVLHIISGNDNGGGANHVLNICSKHNNVFQNIIGCIGDGPLYSKIKAIDVEHKYFDDKINNREIISYVKLNSIDIVNFHGAKPFLMHLILQNKLIVPVVATVHSDYRYDFINNKFKYYIFTPLSTLGLRSFNNYICVSNNLKKLLKSKKFKGTKSVVNNGIDINSIKLFSSREEIRKKYNIKEDKFVFTMVARMHPIKNHKEVIKAFSKLANEFNNVILLLVGDGEIRDELEKLIIDMSLEDKVILTGTVSNPLDYLNASNVSVIASLSEGGAPPLSVLESGIMKKSLIYTKVGDLQEILDVNSGYLINDATNDSIYTSMKDAYLDKNNLKVKGGNLYNIVVNNYTIDKFWDNYFEIYKSILKKQ